MVSIQRPSGAVADPVGIKYQQESGADQVTVNFQNHFPTNSYDDDTIQDEMLRYLKLIAFQLSLVTGATKLTIDDISEEGL